MTQLIPQWVNTIHIKRGYGFIPFSTGSTRLLHRMIPSVGSGIPIFNENTEFCFTSVYATVLASGDCILLCGM